MKANKGCAAQSSAFHNRSAHEFFANKTIPSLSASATYNQNDFENSPPPLSQPNGENTPATSALSVDQDDGADNNDVDFSDMDA